MDGTRLEVKELRVTQAALGGPQLHITTQNGKTLAPIRVDAAFVREFACAAIRATPMEKI